MTYISNPKTKAKHKKTDRDVYFDNLEEAYGNLPVPSDDYADIASVLHASFNKGELEAAIDVIRQHYQMVATALGKSTKYI